MYVSEMGELHTAYKERPFPHEDDQVVEQVVLRCSAVSLCAVFQDPTGQTTEQPGLIP